MSRKLAKKISRREALYEIRQRMKFKRSEDFEAFEEVFDRATLMSVYKLMVKGTIDEIYGCIKAGKECRLFWGKMPDGREIAIKIYLTSTAEFKKGRLIYMEGDPRFEGLLGRSTRALVYAWARKEFRNLKRALDAGVRVPEPIDIEKNVLVMEFIGQDGIPAPLIKEVELEDPEGVFWKLMEYVRKLYQEAELVHGDLSEYNVMIWEDEPVLFDLSQAVTLDHPMAEFFLERDLRNILRYFFKLGVPVPSLEEALGMVRGHVE